MLESVLIEVGSAVAEHVFAVKVSERLRAETIQDFLVRRGHSILDSRKASRQFEQIAEAFADGLHALLEIESPGTPENEVSAALFAVRDSVRAAEIDYESLLAVDLDPGALERAIRESSQRQRADAALSEAGALIYDHVLRESCNYVAEVALQIPDLQGKALREVLQRQTDLANLTQQVLDRMPSAIGVDSGDGDESFELQYRRQIARKLDELQLFGVTVSDGIQKYPLTVANISLALNTGEWQSAVDPDSDEEVVSEDAAVVVANNARLVVRGDAGSGKTTLLQWIAVMAARHTRTEQGFWQKGFVPFFLQLRRYANKTLPTPTEFLSMVTPALSDNMPNGWVARQLKAGRGLILVDGLDELPAHQRNDVRDWLSDLEHTYPDCRYIVTSRPSALADNWTSSIHVVDAELLPMSVQNISSFIDH